MSAASKLTPAQTEAVAHAIRLLIEHFDTVQLFATKHDMASDETQAISTGLGNHYARHAHVEAWLDSSSVLEEPEEED
mgnify:CR=1 FL=1